MREDLHRAVAGQTERQVLQHLLPGPAAESLIAKNKGRHTTRQVYGYMP